MNRYVFMKIFVILLILFIITGLDAAEKSTVRFSQITKDQGLASPYIRSLYQDRYGFVWVGSYHSAIYRYDGISMKAYGNDPSDPDSMPAVEYGRMHLDEANILWIATSNGLVALDLNTEQNIHYINDPKDPDSISPGYQYALYEDPEGQIWLGSDDGLSVFDRQTKKFRHYRHDEEDNGSLAHNTVYALTADSSGTLWIGTPAGVDTFNRVTGKFTHYKHDSADPGSLINDTVFSISMDRTGTLWIATVAGVNTLAPGEKGFRHYYFDEANPASPLTPYLVYDGPVSGRLWAPVYGAGLYEFDRKTGKFLFVSRNDPDDPGSITTDYINAILEDKSGMLWLGGAGGFLSTAKMVKKEFNYFQNEPENPEGFHGLFAKDFVEDKTGQLWVATVGGGLQILNRSTGKIIKRYLHDDGDPGSLATNDAYSVLLDNTGNIWVGTSGGVSRLTKATDKFVHYPEMTGVMTVLQDSRGDIWTAGWAGLTRYDKKTDKFVLFANDPANPKSIVPGFMFDIYEDSSGTIWIGSGGEGLVRYNRETDDFTAFKHDPANPASLSINGVFSVFEDSRHDLWLATTLGLNRFDREKNEFTVYTDKDGLGSNTVYRIQEDNSGNLWIVTNAGLTKYDPFKNTFRSYDTADGILGGDYYGKTCKTGDGLIFFGGNGINYFDPARITDNPYLPPVIITDIKLFNKSVPVGEIEKGRSILTKSVNFTNELELLYRDYVFSFDFAALSFIDASKNQYAYIMEGFEEDWNYTGTRNYATYTNLDPGNYTFRVKAANNDGKWNEEGISLKIKVLPPFWQTWWFRTMTIILIIMLIAAVFFYSIFKLKAKHKAQMVRREVEIARNIQTALLPELDKVNHADYAIEANMNVAESVGGDYYDVIRDRDGRLWLGIGDVTGHGISAGLIMMMAQVGIHNLLASIEGITPVELLTRVNKIMTSNIRSRMKSNQHMTINFLVEKAPGKFEYAGAHEVILIHRAETGEVIQLDTEGFWLGIIDDCGVQMSSGKGAFQLEKNDTLLLYTDGLIEIMNKDHEQFDISRLMDVMRNNCENPGVLKNAINDAIRDFGGIQTDDITYLICQRI